MASFVQRMIGAAKCDAATYEEVEADAGANGQAMGVVVLSCIAAGIGAYNQVGPKWLIVVSLSGLVAWLVWAGLTYVIGAKIMPEPGTKADFGQLLRTVGFSASPGLLKVFGIVPVVGGLVAWVASIWMLITMVIAVRQALDYQSTARAVVVCLIGFLVYMAITIGIGLAVAITAGVAGAATGTAIGT